MYSEEKFTVMGPPLIEQRNLRLLQIGFLICIVAGIIGRFFTGGFLIGSIVLGGIFGGLAFLPFACLYLIYLFGKRRGVPHICFRN